MRSANTRRIEPIAELGGSLLGVEKPARYLGGEAGSIRKLDDGFFTVALCFPDLYEIGMSNNAMRVLYSGLNAMPRVRAERVFAPAPDFEALLARRGIPLYTLESGIALSDVDMLALSLGYELAATSVLAVLESGHIPIRAIERGEGDPIVIVGGPAATNPHPLEAFLDAAYIGEAEAGFNELAQELAIMKQEGASRADVLERLSKVEAVWLPRRKGDTAKRARRAVFGAFAEVPAISAFPFPTVQTVQDHGTVEIMRGCPNGCRFCHAGFYYRPQRAKPYEVIRAEVEDLVLKKGYREITLSSLSSGDYPGIGSLLDKLHAEWGARMVSFQLPSLKINGFTLPILRKLAEVRKSGLTFAIETPVDEWQRSVNKDVSFEQTVAILEEARASGFKQAKFYFMIGLPVPGHGIGEAKAIVDFFERLRTRISLQINVNVGTFVPKPHTPFQWAAQLSEEQALESINFLRSALRRFKNIKLSYHSPFVSQLEGVISRGDERVGELIFAAFKKGARLDSWEEHFNRELWRSVFEDAHWPVREESCTARSIDAELPWDDISVRVSRSTLRREHERAERAESTSACMEECTEPCGVCGGDSMIEKPGEVEPPQAVESSPALPRRPIGRMVFQYTKTGKASYLQHLSVIESFERAFLIADMDIAYSEGFNPMPRLETAQPIPIAVESTCEIASLLLYSEIEPQIFASQVNKSLPEGLSVIRATCFSIHEGKKQRSLGSLEWGSEFRIRAASPDESRRLTEAIRAIIDTRAILGAHVVFDAQDAVIKLRIPSPKNKEHGLIRILESCVEARPVQASLAMVRSEFLADIGDGEAVSFFQAYSVVN